MTTMNSDQPSASKSHIYMMEEPPFTLFHVDGGCVHFSRTLTPEEAIKRQEALGGKQDTPKEHNYFNMLSRFR